MSSPRDLITEIERQLPTVDLSVVSRSSADDIYEAFVFSLVVSLAQARGAAVSFVDHVGRQTKELTSTT